jgi:hypothetical protein
MGYIVVADFQQYLCGSTYHEVFMNDIGVNRLRIIFFVLASFNSRSTTQRHSR